MRKLILLFLILGCGLAQVAFIEAPAISSDGAGVITKVEVEVREGRGRILVTTEPLVGIDTQNSEKLAVQIAQNITGAKLNDKDVIFTFFADVNLVDGPSAGAAMAAATIAALSNKSINPSVMITGTIESGGRIGSVGGVLKKARAVSDFGSKVFLIPKGQRIQVENVKKVSTPAPGVYIETIEPIKIDVQAFANQWGIEIIEVENITEALPYLLGEGFVSQLVLPQRRLENKTLETVSGTPAMEKLAKAEMERARARKLNITDAQNLLGMGYYYSAANSAFRLIIEDPDQDLNELRSLVAEHLKKTGEKLANYNQTQYHLRDLEWVAAAQQRFVQAQDAASSENVADVSAAEEWLYLSDFCIEQIKGEGPTVDLAQLQLKLGQLIDEASKKVMVAQAIGEIQAKLNLDLAVKASEQQYVLAAMNFAIDAIALTDARSSTDPYTSIDSSLMIPVSGDWPIAYLDHAKYTRFVAQTGTVEDVISALFYALRAEKYSSAYTFITVPSFDVKTPVKPGETGVTDNRMIFALAGAYIIALYSVYEAKMSQHPKIRSRIRLLREEIRRI